MALFDNISNILQTGANFALTEKGIGDVRSAGATQQANLGNIANQFQQQMQFKPYTVTTGTGISNVTGEGATNTLSPALQALMQQLQGSATGMFGQAGQPIDARAGEMTAALEAAAAPSRERERLALEERLMGQGRLGVQTSMFGGTPEQLALSKAIEEQRMANVFTGRNQALTEQQQQYNLGAGMFQQSFLPGQMANQDLQVATPFADIQRMLQSQSGVTGANLQMAGAEAGMQSEQLANALRQQQLQGVLNSIFGTSSTGGLLSSIFNKGGSSTANSSMTDAAYQQAIAMMMGEQ
jgi:mannose/fructose-specific phosphotransferase system component IIA